MSDSIYTYIKSSVAAHLPDPPDTDFQRGFLAASAGFRRGGTWFALWGYASLRRSAESLGLTATGRINWKARRNLREVDRQMEELLKSGVRLMSRTKKRLTAGTEKKLRNLKPFKPGQSGNPKGRPKGARNRLGHPFLEALETDFNQFGPQAIALVREKKPEVYMRVVADLLPKEANINVEAGEAFVALWRTISDGLGDDLADRLDDEPAVVVH